MHVFLYEWVTGGGLVEHTGPLPTSMLAEGSAMIAALAADFAAIPGCRVNALRDMRLADRPLAGAAVVEVHSSADHREEFDRLAVEADHTLVMAPEFDGILRQAVGWVAAAGGKSLNASDAFISLASDKHRTAELLRNAHVAAPRGQLFPADEDKLPADFEYPAVLKPVDGAGSQHTLLVHGPADEPPPHPWPRRLERYHAGRAASVAVLCSESVRRTLPPCWQRLSSDGRFTYRGGGLIEDGHLADRAARLALAALAAMPPARGYVGIDVVLGDAPDGGDDVVIEINPRVTTSYVGVRAAVKENLAEVIIQIANGSDATVTPLMERLEFSADGAVWKR